MKVVLDTNVLVSALLSPEGNPAKIYRMFLTGALTLVFSTEILEEYKDVLYRTHLHISIDDADTVLAAIEQYGEKVEPVQSTNTFVDEDDRVFHDAAMKTGAYLVTGNSRHYPKESFIFTPREFLALKCIDGCYFISIIFIPCQNRFL